MQRWTIRDDRRRWPNAAAAAQTVTWEDDPQVASLHYEGPYGPASIAYSNGFTRTRVWGTHIPEGELADGPRIPTQDRAKLDRLRPGVDGHVGETPLRASIPEHGASRRRFYVVAQLGEHAYTLRVRGFPIVRVQLEGPDGEMAWRYAVRPGSRNRAAESVTPYEVTLALLLWSTPGPMTPTI